MPLIIQLLKKEQIHAITDVNFNRMNSEALMKTSLTTVAQTDNQEQVLQKKQLLKLDQIKPLLITNSISGFCATVLTSDSLTTNKDGNSIITKIM